MLKLSDGLFALAAIAGVLVFTSFYDAAFPSAAIDLKLSRGAIKARADDYLRQRGVDPDTFESSLTFTVDGSAAVFLQRVRGIEETSRFAREQLPLWNWRVRWFRSGEKEEFIMRLAPDGRPLRFLHSIPEAAPGDSLSQDSALVLARTFVSEELNVDLSRWRLEDQSTSSRENRLDHSFTWELSGSEIEWRPDDPEAGTGARRLSVDVNGSRVGYFGEYLHVPERFEREQSKQTAVGTLLGLISIGLSFALVLAAAVVAVIRYKHDRIRWRPGLIAGGLLAAVLMVGGALSYPLIKSQYVTEVPYPIFAALALVGAIFGGVLLGVAIWVTTSAGVSLTEETFPRTLKAFNSWVEGRLFTRAAGIETLRGYAVGLAFLGYITLFYVLGRRYLGVWVPAEGPHSELLSMYLPWLVPLLIATQAAVSEEVIYRLFGVSFLERHLKVTFLALLIPAVIWAFGHSTYPVFPVYVRGIELTIAGLIFGWIFIRYGLVTMLVAHFAIDAILLAVPFLRAEGGSYVGYGIAALVCAALPLAVPIVVWIRKPSDGQAAPDIAAG
ncbi:MAG: CPBP family intramembrane metalloprotease [Gemmatimonadetes bacterium]|uniref:CPBP family intramembrane metalloprotease n=1 Tax=Candidatus Kutchimonas denitrificans TaxID=3056748 RepID=A0AAE5CA31_9BACT|nr:CPBP family intramembrane metalloprotease [Gemmatimonadota bacterium]NIR76096.1 CPBP family intramembrane metalloprotease [Candidatus Kutchimonas denitrificans]NIS00475.1 CPBP family intramembrane metalloprotease [Gemmatimonadota bacterium]NIT66133.1 CPBP family intramembrane metalloprotease [Gemmatimonadota bacterium]NIU54211.1 CPBP family intramembrane metalloprotease [Gemmatimonadota bacterium]